MLKIWLPLNGDLHNQGLDDVAVNNSGATVDNNGKIGKCYSFVASGSHILIPYETLKQIGGSSTVSFWVNIKSFNTSYATIFSATTGSYSWLGEVFTFQRNGTSSAYTFHISDGVQNHTDAYCVTKTLSTGVWYHFALVADSENSVIKIYQDGSEVGSYNTSVVPGWAKVTDCRIGKSANGYQGDFLMNDLRIYDRVLSPKEIKELSKGLVLHYPLNRGGFGGDNLIKNSNALAITGSDRSASSSRTFDFNTHIGRIEVLDTTTNYWNAWRFLKTDLSEDPVDLTTGVNTYTYSVDVRVTNYTTGTIQTSIDFRTSSPTVILRYKLQESECDGNWHRVSATATTNDQKNTQALVSFSSNNTIHGSNTVIEYKNLKLERGDKATPWIPNSADALYSAMGLDSNVEYDVSGYGYNGVINNYGGSVIISSETPRYLVSTNLHSENASSSAQVGSVWISGSCPLTTPKQLTICFWLKPMGGYGGQYGQGVFALTNNNSSATDYVTAPANQHDNKVRMNNIDGSSAVNPTMIFISNEWHYYAFTYDGKTAKSYRDGVLFNTSAFSAETALGSCTELYIGLSRAGGVWRRNNNCYSDFRIYSTCLSADDILSLYHTPTSITNNGTLLTQGEISEV